MPKLPSLSDAGARFIGAFEGFVAHCYDDGGRPGVGNCTIGFGHLIHYGPTTQADIRRWGNITTEQAARLLQRDAHVALYAIERYITASINQAQIDSLCSFAFNCGAESLNSHVGGYVNGKPHRWNRVAMTNWHARVGQAMRQWDHVNGAVNPGLYRRREAESTLFATGHYTRAQGNGYAND